MITDRELPCEACCNNNLSCCHNPQILWTMQEMDDLVTARGMDILKGIHMYKGEVPGMLYLIRVNPNLDNARLEYCAFYDPDKNNCSVYEHRPAVCATYGDPKYNQCPYDGMTEDQLKDLAENHLEEAEQMHRDAISDPIQYTQDYIEPWLKAWEEAKKTNPEYNQWWEKLPTANFIRGTN